MFPSIMTSLVGFIVGEMSVLYLEGRGCNIFFYSTHRGNPVNSIAKILFINTVGPIFSLAWELRRENNRGIICVVSKKGRKDTVSSLF